MFNHTEIHPNRVEFHSIEEMRHLQGVGVVMKEQKVVDHRPKNGEANGASLANSNGSANGNNGQHKFVTSA